MRYVFTDHGAQRLSERCGLVVETDEEMQIFGEECVEMTKKQIRDMHLSGTANCKVRFHRPTGLVAIFAPLTYDRWALVTVLTYNEQRKDKQIIRQGKYTFRHGKRVSTGAQRRARVNRRKNDKQD